MSVILCTRCTDMIDSDDDPECFIHDNEGTLTDAVWCEACRDKAMDEADEEDRQAAHHFAMSERAGIF